jgi:hypothetical protein
MKITELCVFGKESRWQRSETAADKGDVYKRHPHLGSIPDTARPGAEVSARLLSEQEEDIFR